MRIGFVGLGNMGTAMANHIAGNGYDVYGWDHDNNVVDEINKDRLNSKYLPGTKINSKVSATNELPGIFKNSQMVFIAVPSMFIRKTIQTFKSKIDSRIIIVNLAKGIEFETGFTSFKILSEIFPSNSLIMLSGPSIANEIAAGVPTAVVIAGKNKSDLTLLSKILDNKDFRTSISNDEIGAELGGILKNIYAIGLGMFDGKGIKGTNFRSVYLTLALKEMENIGTKLGAKKETFYFLAGLGDLFATSLSGHSHNRKMGELLANRLPLSEIENVMGVLPEGYNTLKIILGIAEKKGVIMPLAAGMLDVINGKLDINEFIYTIPDIAGRV